MNYRIIVTEPFERKLKRLIKKHRSLKKDLSIFFEELASDPTMGSPLGRGCYKVRVAISSKGKGKSGGARIITYVRVKNETVFLLDIYDKSEQEAISQKELKLLIELFSEED